MQLYDLYACPFASSRKIVVRMEWQEGARARVLEFYNYRDIVRANTTSWLHDWFARQTSRMGCDKIKIYIAFIASFCN